ATVVYQPPPTSPGQPPPRPTTLSDRSYEWDAVGNLKHVHDKWMGGASSGEYDAIYSYDNLRRIQSATIALPGAPTPITFNFNYCYDALGNLVLIDGSQSCYDSKDQSSTLTLLPLGPANVTGSDGAIQYYGRQSLISGCLPGSTVPPHALARRERFTPTLQSDDLCYDASGKMLSSANRSYTYFARGKVGAITDPAGAISQYVYDGNGVRVSKSEPGKPTQTTQIILGPSYREIASASLTPSFEVMYTTVGGNIARRVVQQPATGNLLHLSDPVWFSTDHLGSTSFLTNLQGQEVTNSRAYYRSFGGFVDPSHPPQTDLSGSRQFTSKELDATGLYDYGARPYDPGTGRFSQADEVEARGNPQGLNRFSYVLNNPLIMTDPTGHDAKEPQWGWQPGSPTMSPTGIPLGGAEGGPG